MFARGYVAVLSDVAWIQPFTKMKSALNTFGDLVIGMVGAFLIYKLRRQVRKAPEIKKKDLLGKN